jgi:hypothetical protein
MPCKGRQAMHKPIPEMQCMARKQLAWRVRLAHMSRIAASSEASQKAAAYTMGPNTGPLPASSAGD